MPLVKHLNSKHWYMAFMVDGKRYFRSTKTANKALAKKLEDAERNKIVEKNRLGLADEAITLKDALDSFIKSRENTPNHSNVLSRSNRLLGFKLEPRAWLKVSCYGFSATQELHTLKTADVERLVAKRREEGLSGATIQHEINTLRGAIKHAQKLGYLVPVITFPQIKKDPAKVRFLTLDEEKRLLCALDPNREHRGLPKLQDRDASMQRALVDVYDLAVLLLDTGMRYAEACSLKWSDIDTANGMIHITSHKVKKESYRFMTERVKAMLTRRDTVRVNEFVFNDKRGGKRKYAASAFRKAVARACIDNCTFHTLRHTFASRLIQSGLSLYEVGSLLHHSDVKTTTIYAHLVPNVVSRKAVSVLNAFSGNSGGVQ